MGNIHNYFQNRVCCEKQFKDNNTVASIWHKNMLGYLSLNMICSSKLTVFVRGQIPEDISAQNGGYCLYSKP